MTCMDFGNVTNILLLAYKNYYQYVQHLLTDLLNVRYKMPFNTVRFRKTGALRVQIKFCRYVLHFSSYLGNVLSKRRQ